MTKNCKSIRQKLIVVPKYSNYHSLTWLFYADSLKVGLWSTFAHPLGFLVAKLLRETETFQ